MTTRARSPLAHEDLITGITTACVVKVSGLRPLEIGRHARRAGFAIEEIFNLTEIDRWFLVQIKEIVGLEEELAGAKN